MMHFPINLVIGSVTINSHLIFEMLSYTIGFQYFLFLRRKQQDIFTFDQRIWIIVAAALGAFLGSRLVGMLSVPYQASNLSQWLIYFFSVKSILGGLVGGLWAVELAKKIMKINQSTGDIFVFPLILGIMIGRLGCFSQGVFDGTHGTPSNLPWAMDMGDGILRHPVQLYEILFLGLLWCVLLRIQSRLRSGQLFKLFMITYLIWRFMSEWIKPVYVYPIGLSGIQISCILALGYYVLGMLSEIKSRN